MSVAWDPNNVVCATSKTSDQPAHMRSLIRAFASRLNILRVLKLLHKPNLEFLSRTGGCTGTPESVLVKMPHCCKSHVTAHIMATVGVFFLYFQIAELFGRLAHQDTA